MSIVFPVFKTNFAKYNIIEIYKPDHPPESRINQYCMHSFNDLYETKSHKDVRIFTMFENVNRIDGVFS